MENRMNWWDHCYHVQMEGKKALKQSLDMCSVDFMRNFNKNFTLCNHKLLSLSVEMLNASVNVNWHHFYFPATPCNSMGWFLFQQRVWLDWVFSRCVGNGFNYLVPCLNFWGPPPTWTYWVWQFQQKSEIQDGAFQPFQLWFHHAHHAAGTDSAW